MADVTTVRPDGSATARRRWIAVGLLVAAVLLHLGINVPFWWSMATFSAFPRGVLSLAVAGGDAVLRLLPPVLAVVGLVRARPWGPAAAVATGLLTLLPALSLLHAVTAGPLDPLTAAFAAGQVLLLAAAVVGGTLLPWNVVTPTPGRALLWVGAGAVVAGRLVPVSAGGRGTESFAAAALRFGDRGVVLLLVLVGAVAILAIAVLADRLPSRYAVGAGAVLAVGGLAPLSHVLFTLELGEGLSPLAGLGPLGALAVVWWLRDAQRLEATTGAAPADAS